MSKVESIWLNFSWIVYLSSWLFIYLNTIFSLTCILHLLYSSHISITTFFFLKQIIEKFMRLHSTVVDSLCVMARVFCGSETVRTYVRTCDVLFMLWVLKEKNQILSFFIFFILFFYFFIFIFIFIVSFFSIK